MSNIKTAGSALEPTVNIEKELQIVKQQTEIKNNEALIQDISRAVTKQREIVQSTDRDDEQEQPKDTAQISEKRRWFLSDGTVSAGETLQWLLEMAGKDWESFLKWQPDPDLDLTRQLQELSNLYLALLEAALKHAEGENLAQQLEQLDSLLAEKLDLVMEKNLEQLTSLLEETGQRATLDSIRSSLYRQTAGRVLSPQAIRALFAGQIPAYEKSHYGRSVYGNRAYARSATDRTPGSHSSSFSASSPSSGEGMIYQATGKQNIRFWQTYHIQQTSWKEQIRQRTDVINNAKKGISQNTFRQGTSFSSGRELEKANGFAAHIRGSGNLFRNPGITARNEEVTGLMAAVMSMKGQVYARESGRTGSIASPFQNAIEKLIDHYLIPKGASKVYYHTLAAYKQTESPQKAIEEGQRYAYQQFREKQKDPAYQKAPQYGREAGFFRSLLKNLSPEKEFSLGIMVLQKDWGNFLSVLKSRQNSSYLPRTDLFSPWGLMADTGIHGAGQRGTPEKIFLGAAVLLLICALAAIWFCFI